MIELRFVSIDLTVLYCDLVLCPTCPKLPHNVYYMCLLLGMFGELEAMFSKNGTEDKHHVITQANQDNAVDLLLEALCAWGSISSLRDRLRLHKLTINESEDLISQTRLCQEVEASFKYQMQQSAGN